MNDIAIRPIEPSDREWVLRFLRDQWGSERQVAHGEMFYPADHPGFLALKDGQPVGLVTYRIAGDACEITLIDAGEQHRGIGTALMEAVERVAREAGCARLWLVTTNDNLGALRFYQRRGFALTAFERNAVDHSRRLKPEIPLIGDFGIPLRDELTLEKSLKEGNIDTSRL